MAAGKQATAAAAGQAHGLSPVQNAEFQDLFQTPSEEEIQQARADLAELGLSFESEADPPNNVWNSKASPHTQRHSLYLDVSHTSDDCAVHVNALLSFFYVSEELCGRSQSHELPKSACTIPQSRGPCSYER